MQNTNFTELALYISVKSDLWYEVNGTFSQVKTYISGVRHLQRSKYRAFSSTFLPVVACLWCELQHLPLPTDVQSHRLLLTRHHCQRCFQCHQTSSVFMSYFFYMFTQWQSIFPSPSLFFAHVLHRFCSTKHNSGRDPTFDRRVNAAW
jgi:hypothetical protein